MTTVNMPPQKINGYHCDQCGRFETYHFLNHYSRVSGKTCKGIITNYEYRVYQYSKVTK